MQTNPVHKKKIFVPGSTKFLLIMASLGGTVGLWNVISNQSLAAAANSSVPVDSVANLPAIPTVVPLVEVTVSPQTSQVNATSSSQLRAVTAPAQSSYVAQPSNSSSAPIVLQAPVTRSGSSK